METKKVSFTLNGRPRTAEVPVHWNLLRFLREGLLLTGTKCSCEEGECGACTVIFNGEAVTSCLIMAADIDGCEIETVEGLEGPDGLHPLQKAFIAAGAIQCGFCTPGMLMSAKALLNQNPHPSEEEIRGAMYGNLCRCTGYEKIIDAILWVAEGRVLEADDNIWQVAQNAEGHGCEAGA